MTDGRWTARVAASGERKDEGFDTRHGQGRGRRRRRRRRRRRCRGARQRLSWLRVGAVVAIVAVLRRSAARSCCARCRRPRRCSARSWSVPYVDVTLTPTYEFQNPESNPARDIALAFVVADPSEPCTPSWGGAYTMDEAKQSIELDRRITQLRAAGGDIMISFGGQANKELAFACTDQAKLTAAYRDVVDALRREGDRPRHRERRPRRQAVDRASRQGHRHDPEGARRRPGTTLAVWVTLPVTKGGLTADGVAFVTSTIKNGVDPHRRQRHDDELRRRRAPDHRHARRHEVRARGIGHAGRRHLRGSGRHARRRRSAGPTSGPRR